jgi:hypothetical protein
MLRAAALALFVLVAYPALFGVYDAPAVGALLAGGRGRLIQLVGLVFLLSLLLPLVPVLGSPAFALPIQGAAGAALVAGWLAAATGSPPPGLWPGPGALAVAGALAYLAHWAARRVAGVIEVSGRRLWQVADAGEVAMQALLLFQQGPGGAGLQPRPRPAAPRILTAWVPPRSGCPEIQVFNFSRPGSGICSSTRISSCGRPGRLRACERTCCASRWLRCAVRAPRRST